MRLFFREAVRYAIRMSKARQTPPAPRTKGRSASGSRANPRHTVRSPGHREAHTNAPLALTSDSKFPIHEAIRRLRAAARSWQAPVVTLMAAQNQSPFHVLIGCLLSLRTQDQVTAEAARRLFSLAKSPAELARVPVQAIAKTIYPVGFYRTKARVIHDICKTLEERYGGNVPSELDELLKLKGVGRKTANLVVTKGFGLPGICVDTHVHRISNRWGLVTTKTPEQTERALRELLPRDYWLEYNDLLVAFGQTICRPLSPLCSKCPLQDICPRKGVTRSR